MQQFVLDFIVPLARKRRWTSICEIGASVGDSTNELLKLPILSHTVIDPCFDEDLGALYAGDPRVTVRKGNSLDILPNLDAAYDCILIDGDHNWFTVFHELRLIRERKLLRAGGMIFFRDVDRPYGRRDMYYQPDTNPSECSHEFARKGIVRGQSVLSGSSGFNAHLCNAVLEGGPKNGVMTAIEDFIAENPSQYRLCAVWHQYGLGILQMRSAPASEGVSFLLLRTKASLYPSFMRLRPSLGRLKRWVLRSLKP